MGQNLILRVGEKHTLAPDQLWVDESVCGAAAALGGDLIDGGGLMTVNYEKDHPDHRRPS